MAKNMFGLALYNVRTDTNIGSLLRTAQLMRADYICIIGNKYDRKPSDTMNTTSNVPTFKYPDFEEFALSVPDEAALVAIELDKDAVLLDAQFEHPKHAIYILGNERDGIPSPILQSIKDKGGKIVQLLGDFSMNVACAGSIVLHDRAVKNMVN